jgi:hypothetical protein
MSYDLYLYRRDGAAPLKKKGFTSYFKGRPHFKINKDQALYENDKTGVYFSFDYSDGKGGGDPEDPNAGREHLYFNMNYFRPHVFGLEAEPVLTAVVKDLDLTVSDPQSEGMGDGEYSPEGFLRGWNAGNRFGHQAYLAMEPRGEKIIHPQHTLPGKTLRACWEWTYRKDELGERFFEDDAIDVFVPSVMYALRDGTLTTLCVWPQLIPTALPAVETVLVLRTELPEKFAAGADKANALTTWKDVRKAAAGFEVVKAKEAPGGKYLLLDYGSGENAPAQLAEFVRGLPAFAGELRLVATDQILDEELVRDCKPKPKN